MAECLHKPEQILLDGQTFYCQCGKPLVGLCEDWTRILMQVLDRGLLKDEIEKVELLGPRVEVVKRRPLFGEPAAEPVNENWRPRP